MLPFYVDDICIFSSSVDEMLDRIALVFSRLKEFNLKIKPKKSFFFLSTVLFLGHLLLKDGIVPNSEKVNKVKDWPIPTTAKEVHSFWVWHLITGGLFPNFLNGPTYCMI